MCVGVVQSETAACVLVLCRVRQRHVCWCCAEWDSGMCVGVVHTTQRRHFTECYNINITLVRYRWSSLLMVNMDRNM